jgi:hypothetical protein
MSTTISLGQTQKGSLDVTAWQEWFLACLLRAIEGTQDTLAALSSGRTP